MKTEGQSATEKLRCQKKKALKHFVVRLEKVSQRDVDKALSLAGLYGGKKERRKGSKKKRGKNQAPADAASGGHEAPRPLTLAQRAVPSFAFGNQAEQEDGDLRDLYDLPSRPPAPDGCLARDCCRGRAVPRTPRPPPSFRPLDRVEALKARWWRFCGRAGGRTDGQTPPPGS